MFFGQFHTGYEFCSNILMIYEDIFLFVFVTGKSFLIIQIYTRKMENPLAFCECASAEFKSGTLCGPVFASLSFSISPRV